MLPTPSRGYETGSDPAGSRDTCDVSVGKAKDKATCEWSRGRQADCALVTPNYVLLSCVFLRSCTECAGSTQLRGIGACWVRLKRERLNRHCGCDSEARWFVEAELT